MRIFIAGRDGIRVGMHRNAGRAVLVVGDTVATRPVEADVQRAIERATEAAQLSLVVALRPFGLHPHDIAMPAFERVIYRDETPIFCAVLRARQAAGMGQQ
ncbi:hypothetical protein J2Y69_002486 [Microbacterium resistens]|uniref:Uncharacterized protein n=1 Tax=Microbacterium resistens TaxID=156977 RepID=A0ABU1SFZ6_9MICO|nr:hypothetical protein [Microbacterium resistens]MDR6867878.1 hypothetical protein [Microbacterium resistens]